jgi:hypothetical protein
MTVASQAAVSIRRFSGGVDCSSLPVFAFF